MGKCRHFLEGKCTYGENCKFEHIEAESGSKEWKDELKLEKKRTRKRVESFIVEVRSRIKARLTLDDRPSLAIAQDLAEIALAGSELPEGVFHSEPLPGTKTHLCPDFILGSCVLGVTCLLAHSPEEIILPKEEVPKLAEEDKPPMRLIVEEDSLGKWVEVDPETLEKMANSKEAYRYKTSLCRLFEVGACPKGDLCVFAHGDIELQLPGQAAKQMRRLQAAPESWVLRTERQTEYEKRVLNRVRREPTRASLCKHFDLGQCRHGKSCKFAHGQEELEIAKKNETAGAQKAEKENATKAAAIQAAAEEDAARVEAVAQSQATVRDAFSMLRESPQPPVPQGALVMPALAGLTALSGVAGMAAGTGLPPSVQVPLQSHLPIPNLSAALSVSNLSQVGNTIPGTTSFQTPMPLPHVGWFVPNGMGSQQNSIGSSISGLLQPSPSLTTAQPAMLAQQLPMQLLPTPINHMQLTATSSSLGFAVPMIAGTPGFLSG